ncbi:MAG: winged helix-turn-helix transcriptional regulator [Dermatophilaceae bacterium]
MSIPDWAWPTLLDAGVRVNPMGTDRIEVWSEQQPTNSVLMHLLNRAHLEPHDVQSLRAQFANQTPLLLIAPTISDATARALEDAGCSWLARSGRAPGTARGWLRLPGAAIRLGEPGREPEGSRATRPGPIPWGRLGLVRVLLTGSALSQNELARVTGLSQPAVSMALKDLASRGIVGVKDRGSAARWEATDLRVLLNEWLAAYPGPRGISTYWYGLDPLDQQTQAAVSLLEGRADQQGASRQPVVSGDAAADLIAPWRRPVRAIIYAAHGADLTPLGLTPATPDEATVEVAVPKDQLVWPSPAARGLLHHLKPSPLFELADPFQIIYDLRQAPGVDADQAAHHVELAVLDAVEASRDRT